MKWIRSILLLSVGAFGGCQCDRSFEDCQNLIDDNGDGFIDCDDEECANVVFCAAPICGDGELNEGEACDDGVLNSDTAPDSCRTDCTLASCGDLVIDTGETCDDGNNVQDDGCHLCTIIIQKTCGNGTVEAGEECDDGNLQNADGCDINCTIEDSCGDGTLASTEECDDGNTNNGDGCSSLCFIEIICGDGVKQNSEECDDGNTQNGDGCNSVCQIESNCGDGIINGPETCDDANINAGDGCDTECLVEPGFTCFGEPSVCSSCGDGLRLPNEICVSTATLPTDSDPFALALFDKEGDGDQDIAVSLNSSNQVWVYQNDSGVFSLSQALFLPPDTLPGGLDVADLDLDGDQDVLVTASNRNRVILLENQSGSLVSGAEFFVGINPDFGIVVEDLNNDGELDIAVVNTDSTQTAPQDTVTILFGLSGAFSEPFLIDVGETPFALVSADFSGDSLPELISGNLDGSSINLLSNDGVFGVSQLLPQQSPIAGLAVGDIDADNDLDLVASQLLLNNVLLFENVSGALTVSQTISVSGSSPVGVTISDLNGDFLPDISTADLSGGVSLLLQHQGAFLPAVSLLTDVGSQPLASGDLNGDGRDDLVVGNRSSNSVSILLSEPF